MSFKFLTFLRQLLCGWSLAAFFSSSCGADDFLTWSDPYSVMEPLMKRFDLVIQENDSWDHFNTGKLDIAVRLER